MRRMEMGINGGTDCNSLEKGGMFRAHEKKRSNRKHRTSCRNE